MIKVFFICPWENSNSLLEKLKKNTPGNKGIWKNLIGIDNINECDYIIILDDLSNSFLSMGINNFIKMIGDLNKIIFFQRENTAILNISKKTWFRQNLLPFIKHNYSYEDDFFYTFTTAHFLNKTYDELKAMEYPKKTKNISCIVSSKNIGPSYKNRIDFIKKYSEKYPNTIDIYGKGWGNELGINYKGELGSYHQSKNKETSKLDGLIEYNYSICLENYPDEKVTSEKITDSLLCWCIPIYSGTNKTCKYFPNDAFKLIDINNENTYEYINNICKNDITEKNINALREARNLILDKYNIWEQVYNIINNSHKYKLYYNHNLLNFNKYLQNTLIFVNNEYKFIYISPSRTGSTTIRKYYNLQDNINNSNNITLNKREKYDYNKFKDYTVLFSTRHPISRYKSIKSYLNINSDMTFNNILDEIEYWPMSLYLKNTVGHISNIDFIIRYENFENDIISFNKLINFKQNKEIPHYNNTNSIVSSLKNEEITYIKDVYKEDFINFNYDIND